MTGNELRSTIEALGMTATEVAADIGVHYCTVSRWLQRKEKPLPNHAAAMLKCGSVKLRDAIMLAKEQKRRGVKP